VTQHQPSRSAFVAGGPRNGRADVGSDGRGNRVARVAARRRGGAARRGVALYAAAGGGGGGADDGDGHGGRCLRSGASGVGAGARDVAAAGSPPGGAGATGVRGHGRGGPVDGAGTRGRHGRASGGVARAANLLGDGRSRAGAGRSDRAVGRVDRIAGATGGGLVRRLSEGCGRELFAAAGRAARHGAGRAGVLSVVRADAGAHGPGVGLGIGGPAGVGGRVAGDGAGSKGGAGGGAADVVHEFGHDAFVRDQRIAHRCDRGGDRVAAVVGAVAGMAAILRGHGFAVAVCRYHGGAAVGGAGVHHGVFCARGVALAGAGQRAGGVGGGGVDRAHHRAGAIVLGELSVVLRDRGVAVDV